MPIHEAKKSKKKTSKKKPKTSKKKSLQKKNITRVKIPKTSVNNSHHANYYINMKNIHYLNVISGMKTVEGRLNRGKFAKMKKGQTIIINNVYKTKIAKIAKYKTFKEMLEKETLQAVLPGLYSLDNGVKIYREFYSNIDEWEFGVVAIHLSKGIFIARAIDSENILKNRPKSSSVIFKSSVNKSKKKFKGKEKKKSKGEEKKK